jgi:hypothetical protein
MNMTVAMTDATVTTSALRKAKIATGSASQRVKTERGMRKMRTKVRQVPVRKRPNIHWETYLTRLRMLLMSLGRLTSDHISIMGSEVICGETYWMRRRVARCAGSRRD